MRCVYFCVFLAHTTQARTHMRRSQMQPGWSSNLVFICLQTWLCASHIITSSGGIIQTNAICSILVSLTPDPSPSAAYPWQPRRVLSQDVLVGLICGSLLKAAQRSLVFSQKIRNPIIYHILIRLVFTPGKPPSWGCFADAVREAQNLSGISYKGSCFLCCLILGGGEGFRECFITCLSAHLIRNVQADPNIGRMIQKISRKMPLRKYRMFSFLRFNQASLQRRQAMCVYVTESLWTWAVCEYRV